MIRTLSFAVIFSALVIAFFASQASAASWTDIHAGMSDGNGLNVELGDGASTGCWDSRLGSGRHGDRAYDASTGQWWECQHGRWIPRG